jgi:hypothetical protein
MYTKVYEMNYKFLGGIGLIAIPKVAQRRSHPSSLPYFDDCIED